MTTTTIKDAREAYATILATLRTERTMRERVLQEPRRSKAIKEIDDAIAALQTLGKVIWAAVDAGLLTAEPTAVESMQAPLLDVTGTVYP